MDKVQACYYCGSTNIINYGTTYYKKPKCKYKACQRQFVINLTYTSLTVTQKALIRALLLERISLEGILQALKTTAYQLYKYMDEIYAQTSQDLYLNELVLQSKDVHLQCFECKNDEVWSFVGNKTNKQWIWVTMHRQSRLIIGFYIGSRGEDGAKGLWQSIPESIRTKAIYYTDDGEAYKKYLTPQLIFPQKSKKTLIILNDFEQQ